MASAFGARPFTLGLLLVSLLAPAHAAEARLTADEVYRLVQTVYAREGVDMTGRSSREVLNRALARAVGIAAFGHPSYNTTPDQNRPPTGARQLLATSSKPVRRQAQPR